MKQPIDYDSAVFVYPDPLTDFSQFSGAILLYFKGPIILTHPPLVFTHDWLPFIKLVEDRHPEWYGDFSLMLNTWLQQKDRANHIINLLSPLNKTVVATVIYPADSKALNNASDLISSASLAPEKIGEIVRFDNAGGEIMRHILLEQYFESGQDWLALYDYCSKLFSESLEKSLTNGYFLRIRMLPSVMKSGARVLLTNPRLIDFLESLPIKAEFSNPIICDRDVIAWEIFKQILSPSLDPLDERKIELLHKLLDKHSTEIHRLRVKCMQLAEKIAEISSLNDLPEKIQDMINVHARQEISDLLELDKDATEKFFGNLFADVKIWSGLAFFLQGLLQNGANFSAGAAIFTLSTMGAHAVKVAFEQRQLIKQHNYAVLYRISKNR